MKTFIYMFKIEIYGNYKTMTYSNILKFPQVSNQNIFTINYICYTSFVKNDAQHLITGVHIYIYIQEKDPSNDI